MTEQNIEEVKEIVEENLNLTETLIENIKDFLPNLLVGIVVFLIGYSLANVVKKIVKKVETKSNIDKSVTGFLSQVLYYFLVMVSLMIALSIMGVNPASWVAILSAIAVGIGLGIKNNLSDIASGIMILIFKPFKVGDFIEYKKEISGTVVSISMMNTCIETLDWKRVYLPNSLLTEDYIVNSNENSIKKVTITFILDYESDHEKAMDILKDMLIKHKDNLNPSETAVFIDAFTIYGVRIIARCEVLTTKYWDMYYEINRNLKTQFDRKGIRFASVSMDGINKSLYTKEKN